MQIAQPARTVTTTVKRQWFGVGQEAAEGGVAGVGRGRSGLGRRLIGSVWRRPTSGSWAAAGTVGLISPAALSGMKFTLGIATVHFTSAKSLRLELAGASLPA